MPTVRISAQLLHYCSTQWFLATDGSCSFSDYEYIVRRLTYAQGLRRLAGLQTDARHSSGMFLLILGLLRAGWLLRFFSRFARVLTHMQSVLIARRPLLTGFLGASALAMLMSQFKYVRHALCIANSGNTQCISTQVVFNDSVHIDDDPSLFKVVYKIAKNLPKVCCARDAA